MPERNRKDTLVNHRQALRHRSPLFCKWVENRAPVQRHNDISYRAPVGAQPRTGAVTGALRVSARAGLGDMQTQRHGGGVGGCPQRQPPEGSFRRSPEATGEPGAVVRSEPALNWPRSRKGVCAGPLPPGPHFRPPPRVPSAAPWAPPPLRGMESPFRYSPRVGANPHELASPPEAMPHRARSPTACVTEGPRGSASGRSCQRPPPPEPPLPPACARPACLRLPGPCGAGVLGVPRRSSEDRVAPSRRRSPAPPASLPRRDPAPAHTPGGARPRTEAAAGVAARASVPRGRRGRKGGPQGLSRRSFPGPRADWRSQVALGRSLAGEGEALPL